MDSVKKRSGFARILVVDDDALMRSALDRMLRPLGAELVEAGSLEAALAALDHRVDLVITDINLGDGNGVELARAAAARYPSTPVIAMSGSAEAAQGLALGRAGVAAFVAKPFTAADLLEVVQGLEAPQHVELDAVARRVVGDWDMPDVLDAVRRSMVFEALSRARGNKAQAAEMLGISRQNLQNILSRGKV